MQGIRVIFVGRTDSKELQSLQEVYTKRIARFTGIELIELPDVKGKSKSSIEIQKEAEGNAILKQLKPQDHLLLLDERGVQYTSRAFAEELSRLATKIPRQLVLAVGGPYGFSDEVYRSAQGMLSLSSMTFSHQMIRIFLLEQLYRAFTILHNHPYHHD